MHLCSHLASNNIYRQLPFLCNSFHYNNNSRLCLLSEDVFEPPVERRDFFGQKTAGLVPAGPTGSDPFLSFHEIMCIQGGNAAVHISGYLNQSAECAVLSADLSEITENEVNGHLFAREERFGQMSEAFELSRNSRLFESGNKRMPVYQTRYRYDIGKCLDECLHIDSRT